MIQRGSETDALLVRIGDIALISLCGTASLVIAGRAFVAKFDSGTTDLPHHLSEGPDMIASDGWTYSVFYHLQDWVDARDDAQSLVAAGLFVLGAMAFLRGALLAGVLIASTGARVPSALVSVLLMLAIPLPVPWLDVSTYLGTISPNAWHNATQFLAFVFGPIAVFVTTLWWKDPRWRTAVAASLAGAASAIAKPALTPSWLAAVAILTASLMFTNKMSQLQSFGQGALIAALPVVSVAFHASSSYGGDYRAMVNPFRQWQYYMTKLGGDDTILLSLARSVAFPVAVLVSLVTVPAGRALLSRWVVPAWTVLGIALVIYIVADEVDPSGRPINAGNFGWGADAANAALFVMSAVALLRFRSRRAIPAYAVLVGHALAGGAYIIHIAAGGAYY